MAHIGYIGNEMSFWQAKWQQKWMIHTFQDSRKVNGIGCRRPLIASPDPPPQKKTIPNQGNFRRCNSSNKKLDRPASQGRVPKGRVLGQRFESILGLSPPDLIFSIFSWQHAFKSWFPWCFSHCQTWGLMNLKFKSWNGKEQFRDFWKCKQEATPKVWMPCGLSAQICGTLLLLQDTARNFTDHGKSIIRWLRLGGISQEASRSDVATNRILWYTCIASQDTSPAGRICPRHFCFSSNVVLLYTPKRS